jgi:indolepyruvate ferredoxin oxidoreductase alpha subunit
MTGGQHSMTTGDNLIRLLEGLGLEKDHMKIITPLPKNLEENAKIMKNELEHRGLSVIIAKRECIQTVKTKPDKDEKEGGV